MDFNAQYYLLLMFLWTSCWCCFSTDCRSFTSSLWTNEPSFLGHVTSLTSSFTPSPRMHHLPTLSYPTQPTPYSSYSLSSPPPPSLNHSGSFQPSSFYHGPNQTIQTMGEDRNIVTSLTNYIDGGCLSIRGEEPVWRPYWVLDVLQATSSLNKLFHDFWERSLNLTFVCSD